MTANNPNFQIANTQGARLYLTPDPLGIWVEVANGDASSISSFLLGKEQSGEVLEFVSRHLAQSATQ